MKILTIDIESSPNLAHVWQLWNINNVSLSQLQESGEIMAFAAKWYGKKGVEFCSTYHSGGKTAMLARAHELLSEADLVVTYNGKRFDIPYLNAEFARLGWTPPEPYAQVDLFQVVKSSFRFPSNKLDYVCQELGIGSKTSHTGHQLWVDCLAGDPKAWALMKRYNIQDVRITEALYEKCLPWIRVHPSRPAYDGVGACPNCGGENLVKRGLAHTPASTYQQFRCSDCGKWLRAAKREANTKTTAYRSVSA